MLLRKDGIKSACSLERFPHGFAYELVPNW